MSELPFAATTPIHVGRVGLIARDADALAAWYRDVVGLHELGRADGNVTMGAGERPLLEIEQRADARPDDPRGAGLFHTAFLLPSRVDLGRWIRNASERRYRIDGASDHLVSEALYLNDPEGNGVEIYADRPKDAWDWDGNLVRMATERLDLDGLAASVPGGSPAWTGLPSGSVVGHVHLRVGDPLAAEEWWKSELGLDTVARYGSQAVFMSTGGYHHHVGANSWQSRGAGARDRDRSGLAWVELLSRDASADRTLHDPWGSEIRVRAA